MEATLYGSISELKKLESLIDIQEGEVENLDAIYLRQKELCEFIVDKTDSVSYYNQSLEDYIEALEKRIAELEEAKKFAQNKQKRFHKYILDSLKLLGVERLSGKLLSISIRKGRESIDVYNEKLLPPDCLRVKTIVEADKEEIKRRLKNNEDIQGAKIIIGEPSIAFKVGVKK